MILIVFVLVRVRVQWITFCNFTRNFLPNASQWITGSEKCPLTCHISLKHWQLKLFIVRMLYFWPMPIFVVGLSYQIEHQLNDIQSGNAINMTHQYIQRMYFRSLKLIHFKNFQYLIYISQIAIWCEIKIPY